MCHTWDLSGCGGWEGSRGWPEGWELVEIKGVGPCGEWDSWDNEVGNKDLIGGRVSYRWK